MIDEAADAMLAVGNVKIIFAKGLTAISAKDRSLATSINQGHFNMTDAEKIAEFLATKGATKVEPGLAYGVNADADKAKRAAERERKADKVYADEAEHRAETAADFFFTGDTEAGYEALTGYRRVSEGVYTRVRFNRF